MLLTMAHVAPQYWLVVVAAEIKKVTATVMQSVGPAWSAKITHPVSGNRQLGIPSRTVANSSYGVIMITIVQELMSVTLLDVRRG